MITRFAKKVIFDSGLQAPLSLLPAVGVWRGSCVRLSIRFACRSPLFLSLGTRPSLFSFPLFFGFCFTCVCGCLYVCICLFFIPAGCTRFDYCILPSPHVFLSVSITIFVQVLVLVIVSFFVTCCRRLNVFSSMFLMCICAFSPLFLPHSVCPSLFSLRMGVSVYASMFSCFDFHGMYLFVILCVFE